jgi:hypothetical protein
MVPRYRFQVAKAAEVRAARHMKIMIVAAILARPLFLCKLPTHRFAIQNVPVYVAKREMLYLLYR